MTLPLISLALVGHAGAQAPQERHFSLSSRDTPFSMRTAPAGQTFSQAPQPVHRS